jgi:hypothetical protein
MLLVFTAIASVLVIAHLSVVTSTTAPSELFIGGLFRSFDFYFNASTSKYSSEAIELGILQVSSFLLAIDQINNKTDGVLDDILPNTLLKVSIDINQRALPTLNPSYFFDGGVSSYQTVQNVLNDGYVPFTIVNGLNDESTFAAVETLNGWKVPSLIVQANTEQLSHAGKFPYNLRLVPSHTFGAAYVYDILRSYNWNKIALLYTTDTFGLDAIATFDNAASSSSDNPIEYLANEGISYSTTDYASLMKKLKATGTTIFVVLMNDKSTARFLLHAYQSGLFVEGSQVIGIGFPDSIYELIAAGATTSQAADIMQGYLNVRPAPELYYQDIHGPTFLKYFRSLPPSKTIAGDGSVTCSNRRDDTTAADNYIFKYTSKDGAISQCLGITSYASYAADGSNLNPLVLYPYAAVQGYAKYIHALIKQGYPIANPTDILNKMLNNDEEINTLVGNYSFFEGIASRDDFGKGDRFVGHVYQIQNFDAAAYFASGYNPTQAFRAIGYISDADGVSFCQDSSYIFNCKAASYRTADETSIPSDSKPDRYQDISSSTQSVYIFFAVFILLLTIGATAFYTNYRHMKSIHNAQYKVILVTTLAAFFSGLRVMMSALETNMVTCTTRLWFEHMAFRMMFGTLMLKLWRIHAIINTIGIKRMKIKENDLMYYIAGHNIAVLLAMLIITAGDGISVEKYTTVSANQATIQSYCRYDQGLSVGGVMLNAVYGSEALYIASACYYMYQTRSVPTVINETRVLAPMMSWSILVIVVVLSIIIGTDLNPIDTEVAITAGFIAITIPSTLYYLEHKVRLVYAEIQRNAKVGDDKAPNQTVGINIFAKLKSPPAQSNPNHAGTDMTKAGNTDLSDNIEEEYEKAVQAMNQKSSFMEKVVFVQKHLDVWRALYVRLSDEESSGNSDTTSPHGTNLTNTGVGISMFPSMTSQSLAMSTMSPSNRMKNSFRSDGMTSMRAASKKMLMIQQMEHLRIEDFGSGNLRSSQEKEESLG